MGLKTAKNFLMNYSDLKWMRANRKANNLVYQCEHLWSEPSLTDWFVIKVNSLDLKIKVYERCTRPSFSDSRSEFTHTTSVQRYMNKDNLARVTIQMNSHVTSKQRFTLSRESEQFIILMKSHDFDTKDYEQSRATYFVIEIYSHDY